MHICCTQFSLMLCLPNTRWRQGTLHLVAVSAAMTSSRLYENGITDFLEAGRGSMLAMPATLCSPAAAVPTEKVEATVKEKVGVGNGKDAAVKAPTGTVVARLRPFGGNGSSAKATDGGTSEVRCHRCGKKGHWRIDCTEELCSRCHGRGHAAGVCPTSKKEAVLTASDDDDGYDTVEASAFKAGEIGECGNVSGRKGEGESAWQVGDEAWFCDSRTSTHMTPSADGMINYRVQFETAQCCRLNPHNRRIWRY